MAGRAGVDPRSPGAGVRVGGGSCSVPTDARCRPCSAMTDRSQIWHDDEMRRILVLLAGCGRIGFAPVGSGSPDAELPSFYVSPTGSDLGAGTRSDPWGTLSFSVGRLHAGDRLTL